MRSWQVQDRSSWAHVGADSTLLNLSSGEPTGLTTALPLYPVFRERPPGAPLPPLGSQAGQDQSNGGGPDSMLKYTAATALYQEVQLLNRHIRDAAIPAGFRPYMVRLQLSLMPSRRHAP